MKQQVVALFLGSMGTLMPTVTWAGSLEDANKKIVVGFYTKAFGEGKTREAAETFIDAKTYIQHNPHVASGRQAFIDFFETYFATHKDRTPSVIKRVIAEGDLVVLHVESRKSPQAGTAVVDIFRVAAGKIVEHWDVMQEIPSKSVSGNGMF